MKNVLKLGLLALMVGMFSSCDFLLDSIDDPTPTETVMKDNMWKVTHIYDEDTGEDILDSIQLGLGNAEVPFIFNMKDNNDFSCSAGPLFLYLVYGDGKWTNIAGKVDQVFNYIEGEAFTTGEWGIGDGQQETFMVSAKLQPPGFDTFVGILSGVFGLETFSQKLDKYAIHKFKFVNVDVNSSSMTWEITSKTETEYYTKVWSDAEGDLVETPFYISGTNFSRCTIVMEPFNPITSAENTLYNKLLN